MNYVPIRLSTLRALENLDFDIYVPLPEKHLLYVRKGDFFEEDQMARLKRKKVRKLFIRAQDEGLYQAYIDKNLNSLAERSDINNVEKASIFVSSVETEVEKVYSDPTNRKTYFKAQNIAKNLINIMAKNEGILKDILAVSPDAKDHSLQDKASIHATNTASLAGSFGEYQKLSKEDVELLTLAGLYHDVGFSQYNEDGQKSFFKPFKELSSQDQVLFMDHPRLGAELLQDKDFANPKLIDLIYSHEERNGGNGFPKKILKLSPLQEVLAITALYDSYVTYYGMDQKKALEEMALNQMGNFDFKTLTSFKNFMQKSLDNKAP